MNPLLPKTHPDQDTFSKASSKKSRKKNKRVANNSTQSAGQPTGALGGASVASARSRGHDRNVESSRGNDDDSDAPGKCLIYSLGTLHAIDAGLGIPCIVYGGIVSHVVEVMAACVSYGLLLSLGAISGVIGYYSKSCKRLGLVASAAAGFLTAILNIIALVEIFFSWDSFIKFLDDNKEELLLSEGSIKTIGSLQILFAVIFAFLAFFEAYRFFAVKEIRRGMVEADSRQEAPQSSQSQNSWFGSMFGFTRKQKSSEGLVTFDDNASLQSALLTQRGSQHASEHYLAFVPEYEGRLADASQNISLPRPSIADRSDY